MPYLPAVYSGARTPTLTVTGTTAPMRGHEFRCVVSNGIFPSAISAIATLTVAEAPTITSANTATFTAGTAGSFTVTATGAPQPTFSVASGSFPTWATLDATTGVISGTPSNGAGAPFSFTLQANNGQGSPATQAFTVRVNAAPIFSVVPARRQTVISGQTLMLAVSAPLATAFQWKRNGRPVPGATSANYTATAVKSYRDTGWYQVVATNSDGSTESPVIFVNVVVSPPEFIAFGISYGSSPPVGLQSVSAVASGEIHSLALNADGKVVAWGWDASGELQIPAGLSEVVSLSAGGSQSAALRSDGTLVRWGPAISGETTMPVGLAGVVQVAAGAHHTLALKADGTVVAWGTNVYQQLAIPAGLTNVVAVAAGYFHSVALKADGTVVTWGGTYPPDTAVPGGLTDVKAIVANNNYTLALKSNGTVVGWGENSYGQTVPPTGLTAVALAAGPSHALALLENGTVVGWGSNDAGEVTVPSSATKVVALAAGARNGLLLRDLTVPVAPAIFTQPVTQSKSPGQTVTFTVAATGTAPLTYRWQCQATGTTEFSDLTTSSVYGGVATATLTITGTTAAMSGDQFRCIVSNGIGTPATSAVAELLVVASPAFTSAASASFFINRAVEFAVSATGTPAPTFTASGLPAWATIDSATGRVSGTAPDAIGAPFALTLTASNGIAPAATQTFTLHVRVAHSADVSPADGALNLAELTRVIELYNTRNGTLRTGRYVISASTVDGFAPDPSVTAGPIPTAPHSADTNRDGRISLTELTRVIELFATRSGTSRTGAYHVPAAPTTTEDGFAPGP